MTRRVLVTGAASGLGKALTEAFRAAGDEVLATDRSPGVDLQLDITSEDDWQTALEVVRERWGGLDILVNNAGITIDKTVLKMTDDDWEKVLSVNLSGAFYLSQAAMAHMVERGSGRIVNVSGLGARSTGAVIGSMRNVAVAAMTKEPALG